VPIIDFDLLDGRKPTGRTVRDWNSLGLPKNSCGIYFAVISVPSVGTEVRNKKARTIWKSCPEKFSYGPAWRARINNIPCQSRGLHPENSAERR